MPKTATATPETTVTTVTKTKPEDRPKVQPPYHVVLINDEDHSYDYVVEMLCKLFRMKVEQAFLIAVNVDLTGRAIVDTTTKERAELKRDQIHSYGGDRLVPECKGSMTADIEPAM